MSKLQITLNNGNVVDAKNCISCGKLILKYATVCPHCGSGQRVPKKSVAFLLCLFLGVFGAHKFYQGKIGMGILYLLTGGLFLIGAFIDLFVILSKP